MKHKTINGSKADNLNRLREAGFNVPKFYVIKSEDNSPNQSRDFELWKKDNSIESVAIRSSSTIEDSSLQSFAGQFVTVLDVRTKKDFIGGVNKVKNSKPSESYSKNIGHVHVIVQEFIEPDMSGVVFSINPANGNSDIVINVARGRGDKVVEGKEAIQYIASRLNPKKIKLLSDSPSDDILDKMSINELIQTTIRIENLFNSPQDIEWAIKDNILYILQSRPITNIAHLRLWDSSNIAESFPGIVKPLTFSIARRGYQLGYKSQGYQGGLSWYDLEKHKVIFDSMIGIFNGRLYYNLLSWYRYISLFPGGSKNQKFLDDQIATQGQGIYLDDQEHTLFFKLRYFSKVLYRLLFFSIELRTFYKRYATFEVEHDRMPRSGDSQVLLQKYHHIEGTIIPHFGRTLDNDFLVMTYHGWLKKLCSKWLPNTNFDHVSIIGAMSNVISAKQAITLYEIALRIAEDHDASKLLSQQKYTLLSEYLKGSQICELIENYINNFGHRFAEDQKIESINPVLKPHGIYEMLYAYSRLDPQKALDRAKKSKTNAEQFELTIKKSLKAHQRAVYAILLKYLKKHLRIREYNRLLRGKIYARMRLLFPELGKALQNEGVLENWDDIYYTEINEIEQLLWGLMTTIDLKDRISRRRLEYRKYEKITMPERFISRGAIPYADFTEISLPNESIKKSLHGLISSPGNIEGRVVVLREPIIPKEPFDILVASHTDPGWTPLIALAKGVIVEHGGMLSHAAIVTRELGIPSIIGVEGATKQLKSGMKVRINTQKSCVEVIKD